MNTYSNIKIAYYSGTGGTELVAKSFQINLKARGCICTVEKITSGMNVEQGDHDLLLLLFPVYAFNAPEAVYQWIHRLNTVNHTAAVVISVSGGGDVCPNTASRAGSIKRLTKKGYCVLYDKMMVMPSNFMAATPSPLPSLLIKALPDAVDQITSALLSGVSENGKPLWIDRLFSVMGKMEKRAGHFWGRRIKVMEHCTKCGWCAKYCPSGNITMLNEKPTFSNRCHLCLKCIYGCPSKALQPGICKFIVIEEGYCLKDIKEKLPENSQGSVKELKVGFLWKGVKKYLLSLGSNLDD